MTSPYMRKRLAGLCTKHGCENVAAPGVDVCAMHKRNPIGKVKRCEVKGCDGLAMLLGDGLKRGKFCMRHNRTRLDSQRQQEYLDGIEYRAQAKREGRCMHRHCTRPLGISKRTGEKAVRCDYHLEIQRLQADHDRRTARQISFREGKKEANQCVERGCTNPPGISRQTGEKAIRCEEHLEQYRTSVKEAYHRKKASEATVVEYRLEAGEDQTHA